MSKVKFTARTVDYTTPGERDEDIEEQIAGHPDLPDILKATRIALGDMDVEFEWDEENKQLSIVSVKQGTKAPDAFVRPLP